MSNNIVDDFIEIRLKNKDDFLKVKETLTRIGVASKDSHKLFQSCHILHKKGKYYIVHFKELFKLDNKPSSITQDDVARRNLIVSLLSKWGLVELVDEDKSKEPMAAISAVKIISHKEKKEWELITKYNIGNVKK